MSQTYFIIVILSLLSGLTTLIGVALAVVFRRSTRLVAAGIGFSAGIMVLISACELIPQAAAGLSPVRTAVSFAAGVLALYLLNILIPHTHLIKTGAGRNSRLTATALLVAFGLIMHDVPEGFAMANSYLASPALGLIMAIAIALHNIPEEFAMTVPLVAASSTSFLYRAAFISAWAEPAGAVIGIFFVRIWSGLQPHFLAVTAGAMIFIAWHELLPMARRYRHAFSFFAGIMVSILVYLGLNIFI